MAKGYSSLGKVIAMGAIAKGITLDELSKRVGTNKSYMSVLLRQRGSSKYYYKIAKELDIVDKVEKYI